MAGDAVAMPPQERVRSDEPTMAVWPGKRLSDRGEKRTVVVVHRWPIDLAAQHGELVAQHEDLDFIGAPRAHGQARQRREGTTKCGRQGLIIGPNRVWSTTKTEFRAPTGYRDHRLGRGAVSGFAFLSRVKRLDLPAALFIWRARHPARSIPIAE